MTGFAKLLRSQSDRSRFDGLFSQWGAIGSGLVFLVLAAGDPTENGDQSC